MRADAALEQPVDGGGDVLARTTRRSDRRPPAGCARTCGQGPVRDRGQPALVERRVAELDERLVPAAVVPGEHRRRQPHGSDREEAVAVEDDADRRVVVASTGSSEARPRADLEVPRRRQLHPVADDDHLRAAEHRRHGLLDRDLARLVEDHDVERRRPAAACPTPTTGSSARPAASPRRPAPGSAEARCADRLVRADLAELVLQLAPAGRPDRLALAVVGVHAGDAALRVRDRLRNRARSRAVTTSALARWSAGARSATRSSRSASRSPSSRFSAGLLARGPHASTPRRRRARAGPATRRGAAARAARSAPRRGRAGCRPRARTSACPSAPVRPRSSSRSAVIGRSSAPTTRPDRRVRTASTCSGSRSGRRRARCPPGACATPRACPCTAGSRRSGR